MSTHNRSFSAAQELREADPAPPPFRDSQDPNYDDPLNKEAADVLRDNPSQFAANVRRSMAVRPIRSSLCAASSLEALDFTRVCVCAARQGGYVGQNYYSSTMA